MADTRAALAQGRSGLVPQAWPNCDVPCFLGVVDLPDDVQVPAERESRNNRLIEHALGQDEFDLAVAQAVEAYGPQRVGLVMGTSTSSIDRTEQAYADLDASEAFKPEYLQPHTHNPHAPGDFVAARLGIQGPCMTVSAACASSAKVFAAAQRWLQLDLVDAVVVGGADSLCLSVIYGFHSLQLVAPEPCRPFAADRQGISLGEAAGFALLSKSPSDIHLAGVGESCDAYHMSSAHPDGLGAQLCMQRALAAAEIDMHAIDYVNLHGTGTQANDATEAKVCAQMRGDNTLFSATKGWTGHTLGAAGIVEAVVSMNAIQTGCIPGTMNTIQSVPELSVQLDNTQAEVRYALTNSFGFGGNNCAVIFAQA